MGSYVFMSEFFKRIKDDPRIRNSFWMLIEKSIALFGLIFIISAVAKYTGPSIYGEISLAASIFIVIKTIAQLGLDQIFFKYVSQKKPFHFLFFKNASKLVSIIYLILSFVIIFISYFYASTTGFYFILATFLAYYFNSIDLLNAYYEGVLLSKINVFANVIGLLISLVMRWVIVVLEMDYIYLCVPIVLMTLIPFMIKLFFYYKKYLISSKVILKKTVKNKRYMAYLLGAGFPLMLAVITATVNGQAANFLLGYLENTASVGIFSIAFVLAGAWCIVPTTLIMSYMTSIYSINNNDYSTYIKTSSKITRNITLMSLFIVFVLYVLSPYFIDWLYGKEFYQSIEIFKYLIFFQLLWVINFLFSRIIIKFNGFRFLAVKSIILCFLNIIISYTLIKEKGMLGAAFALIIVEALSFISNFLFKPAKFLNIVFKIGVTKS